MDGGSKMWIDEELANSKLSDKRLKKRLVRITEQISANIGETIPNACEDWANTKGSVSILFKSKCHRIADS